MKPWHQPSEPLDDRRVSIERVPAGASWRIVVTSLDLAALKTHHYCGRTLPCLTAWGMDCRACAKESSYRREGYVGAYILSQRRPAVVVLPDAALEQLEQLLGPRVHDGTLQHAGLLLERPGESRRGRLKVSWFGDSVGLPSRPLNVPLILCRAWGMPALYDKWREMLADERKEGKSAAG